MRNHPGKLILIASSLAAAFAGPAGAKADMGYAEAGYKAIVESYYRAEHRLRPVMATALGLHAGDARLDSVSAASHAATAEFLHRIDVRLKAIDPAGLSPMERDDREILMGAIGGHLLEEESVQHWKHDPDTYVSLASNAIYTLIERDFAPLRDRLASVVARERAIPAMLADGKKNLADVPPVFVDIAIEDAAGAVNFIGKDVPEAFISIKDSALQKQLTDSTNAALTALKNYQSFLDALKPQAHGSFVLGQERLRRLLASDLITMPAETVLDAGKAQLAKDKAAFVATEKKIDPQQPDQALSRIARDHPDAAQLVPMARGQMAELQHFINEHHIVTLPSQALPLVAETPEFQRAVVFGELDPPGPYETHASTAYFYVTPPDEKLPAAEQQKYLEYFNRPLLENLAVHEALPGHFVQFLVWNTHAEWSPVRKEGNSYTAVEGWAHYTEQMMPDAGLGNGDPKLRLAQLQDALLRDCRLIASISMHTGRMTLDQASKMMETECFQPSSVAFKEARRGAEDPGYFSYTLGKLEILKLRADLQAQLGAKFSLGHFHDQFLAAGPVPISITRREITGKDEAML